MKRRLNVSLGQNGKQVEVMGVDANGAPYELFKEVKVSAPGSFDAKSILRKAMPYKLTIPEAMK